MTARKHVVVAGAGIVGASLAWHLTRAGARVTVLEAGARGGLATPKSWAWINASWGNPEPYFRLRERSMMEWRKLDRDVPGLSINWCGGLIWDLPEPELDAFAKQHAAWGYGIREVDAEDIGRLEPNLKTVPKRAYHVAEEGMIEPLATTRAMLAGAEALGAEVFERTAVTRLGDKGVYTDAGFIHADEVIVAAGVGATDLLASLDIKFALESKPGLLVHSTPAGELLRGLVITPELHVRQTAEGRLVAGSDLGLEAKDLFSRLQALVRGAENLALDFETVGHRPVPADGLPAVGRLRGHEGLYLAVTHSGVTLAPAIGLFVAEEILDGDRESLLSFCNPDRLIA